MSDEQSSPSRVAVCSWSLQPDRPEDLARRVRELDLSAVQIALSPCVREPEIWGRAPEILAEAGVRIVSGMMAMAGEDYSTLKTIAETGGVRPDARWPDHREHAAEIADLASSWSIDLVTFHAGFLPEDPADPERARMLERLMLIADLFAARSIDLALETGQETAGTLRAMLDDLDRANVGVNFDPANIILYDKGDPVESLEKLKPFVRQVHVKDAVRTRTPGTWGEEVPVGEGEVDWPAFFRVSETIEPPVTYVIEREAGEDRAKDIRAASEMITGLIAKKREV